MNYFLHKFGIIYKIFLSNEIFHFNQILKSIYSEIFLKDQIFKN
jgi:hypothetical protein